MHPLDIDNAIKRAFRELFIGDTSYLPILLDYISDNYYLKVCRSGLFSIDSIYLKRTKND